MITQIVNLATNWTTGVNRLTVGALSILWLDFLGLAPSPIPDSISVENIEVRLGALAGALVFLLASLLLGSLIVPLGRIGFGNPAISEARKVQRFKRIGETQNPLLMELCREAHNRADIVMGVMGLIFFIVLTALVAILTGTHSGSVPLFEDAHQPSLTSIQISAVTLFAFVMGRWMKRTVCETLERLDDLFATEKQMSDNP